MKPFKGEVLDGVVKELSSDGIMIQSGPLDSFISAVVSEYFDSSFQRIKDHFYYDSQSNSYVSKGISSSTIQTNGEIKYRLD